MSTEHYERTNRVNRVKRMSRKIPTAIKELALRLWLQGYAYREIRDKTKMSLGAINQMVAEVRNQIPDIEELRQVNIMLRKSDSNVYDAARGARLLDVLNEWGVGLDTLHSYIELSDRISSERGVEAERFIENSVKLMGLEAETGRSYEEVVKEFEESIKRAKSVQEENRKLVERKAQVEVEIREAGERLSSTRQELTKAVSTWERLKKIGLEKISSLAQFIEDFELLRFDVNTVRKLASWRKSLADMQIDPDKLEGFIKKKGSLYKHISSLERKKSARELEVNQLKGERTRLRSQVTSLIDDVGRLSGLGYAVKEGKLTLPCKVCKMLGVPVGVTEMESAITKGLECYGQCIFCGQWSSYPGVEVAWYLAQHVLPAIRPPRRVTPKKSG